MASLIQSPDLNKLAICSRDDKVQVVDVRGGGVLMNLSGPGYHVGCDWSRVSLSPTGDHLAAGGGEGGLYVWSVLTGSLETSLTRGHSSTVSAVSYHTGGMNIVSVDKTSNKHIKLSTNQKDQQSFLNPGHPIHTSKGNEQEES